MTDLAVADSVHADETHAYDPLTDTYRAGTFRRRALDKDLTAPPGAPAIGNQYLLTSGALTGAWAGKQHNIAVCTGTGPTVWKFVPPNPSVLVYMIDEGIEYAFDGAAWGKNSLGIYMPDARPITSHALDYEGDSALWGTDYDHGNIMAPATFVNGHMALAYTNTANTTWAGKYKAKPAAEFTAYAKIHSVHLFARWVRSGFAIYEDATNPNARLDVVFLNQPNQSEGDASGLGPDIHWISYSKAITPAETPRAWRPFTAGPYFRWRINGSNANAGHSHNGVDWYDFAQVALGYTPQHFGPALASNATNMTQLTRFIRVFDAAGSSLINATMLGREI